jgi:uncharacterized protein YkwD
MMIQVTLLLLLIIQGFPGHAPGTVKHPGWEISALNTAAGAVYLSPMEKDLILEINKLRSDPARYAEEYIAPLAKHYDRRLLYYPGDKGLLTKEGVRALHECVRELKRHSPMPLVYPSRGLTRAARDHVSDQSRSGRTGHLGGDRSTLRTRIERYGEWKVRIAENIAYGGKSAKQIVIYLLIDDGIPGRGHRKNFLNPEFKMVGVATGSHPEFKQMSVMDFAGTFKSTPQ